MTDRGTRTIAFCFHHAERSGASLWLERFLLAKPLSDWRVIAVLPSASPMEESLRAAGYEVRVMNVTQRALSSAGGAEKLKLLGNRVGALGEYRKLFKRECVDLVYVNSSLQIAPMVAARSAGCRLVVHVHEAWARGRTFALKRAAIRRLAHGAVFASQRGMALFGGEPTGRPWLFSPNGVDRTLSDVRNDRAAIREELGLADDELALLFLGTLQTIKGVHDLLKIWPTFHEAHPRTRLLLAGSVSRDDSHPTIEKFVRDGLDGATYLGFRNDAARLIAAADWMVLPSYGEAMPLSVVEAMMIGTPVVARDVGDVGWLLADGRGVVFEGDGAEALHDAMNRALTADGDAIQAAAQAFSKAELTREKQNGQVVGFLEEILENLGVR